MTSKLTERNERTHTRLQHARGVDRIDGEFAGPKRRITRDWSVAPKTRIKDVAFRRAVPPAAQVRKELSEWLFVGWHNCTRIALPSPNVFQSLFVLRAACDPLSRCAYFLRVCSWLVWVLLVVDVGGMLVGRSERGGAVAFDVLGSIFQKPLPTQTQNVTPFGRRRFHGQDAPQIRANALLHPPPRDLPRFGTSTQIAAISTYLTRERPHHALFVSFHVSRSQALHLQIGGATGPRMKSGKTSCMATTTCTPMPVPQQQTTPSAGRPTAEVRHFCRSCVF